MLFDEKKAPPPSSGPRFVGGPHDAARGRSRASRNGSGGPGVETRNVERTPRPVPQIVRKMPLPVVRYCAADRWARSDIRAGARDAGPAPCETATRQHNARIRPSSLDIQASAPVFSDWTDSRDAPPIRQSSCDMPCSPECGHVVNPEIDSRYSSRLRGGIFFASFKCVTRASGPATVGTPSCSSERHHTRPLPPHTNDTRSTHPARRPRPARTRHIDARRRAPVRSPRACSTEPCRHHIHPPQPKSRRSASQF